MNEDIGHYPVYRCDGCDYRTWGDVDVLGQEHSICGGTFDLWPDPSTSDHRSTDGFRYELAHVSRDVRVYSVFDGEHHIGSVRRAMASWPRKVAGARYTFGRTWGVRFTPYTPAGEKAGAQYDTREQAARVLLEKAAGQ